MPDTDTRVEYVCSTTGAHCYLYTEVRLICAHGVTALRRTMITPVRIASVGNEPLPRRDTDQLLGVEVGKTCGGQCAVPCLRNRAAKQRQTQSRGYDGPDGIIVAIAGVRRDSWSAREVGSRSSRAAVGSGVAGRGRDGHRLRTAGTMR